MLADSDYLKKILTAGVYDVAVRTDCQAMPKLSAELGCEIFLKREDQQPVKSFKLRGAYAKMAALSTSQKQQGVIAASAGNHAQGVAFAAARKDIPATIVMPETTPDIKVEAVRRFGQGKVNVVLHGNNFDLAKEHADQLAAAQQLTLVHPFDDPDVIAGQGTIAKELMEQVSHLDKIYIAVGGGGLAAGIAVYLKQLKPEIEIIAVESEESACLQAALQAGQRTALEHVGIFADGVAVRIIGEETFRLCQQYVDRVMTVSNDEICAAIKDIFDDTRVIAEPAGALSIAAIRKDQANNQGTRVAGILCGANINFHTLRYVSERCELGEGKEAILSVAIPEQKGAFKQFCETLGRMHITEFNYRFASVDGASIFVGVKLKQRDDLQPLLDKLAQHGYRCENLSDNEIAKMHLRYMVGGKSPVELNERVFSFEFPEAPGALNDFLHQLGDKWNITLFHYRNHGAAKGMVLAGFDVAPDAYAALLSDLQGAQLNFQEHTDDPAYQHYLG